MFCRSCARNVVEDIRERLNLSTSDTDEILVQKWVRFHASSSMSLDIMNPSFSSYFIRETIDLSRSLDLVAILKRIAKNNSAALNILCAMAYNNLLDAPGNDEVWEMKQKDGSTVAHWGARGGKLCVPYDSSLWCARDVHGYTPAHWFARVGELNAPYESDLWYIQDNDGWTPAHWAAKNGFLRAPYDLELWRIKNKWGDTPAHWAALSSTLDAPYESDLWRIQNKDGNTPAHWVAYINGLREPYELDLWRIQNKNGDTPIHFAARNGLLNCWDELDLWHIRNKAGDTPAHCLVKNGHPLMIHYKNVIWFVPNKRNETPAKLTRDALVLLMHHPGNIIKKFFSKEFINFQQCQNIWDVLGYIRLSVLFNGGREIPQRMFQVAINEIKPRYPELCDFYLILKNVTHPRILGSIQNNAFWRDIYCSAIAGSLAYLLTNAHNSVDNILFESDSTFVDKSIFSTLTEWGLLKPIIYTVQDNYGDILDISKLNYLTSLLVRR